jgi:hypothetical protein
MALIAEMAHDLPSSSIGIASKCEVHAWQGYGERGHDNPCETNPGEVGVLERQIARGGALRDVEQVCIGLPTDVASRVPRPLRGLRHCRLAKKRDGENACWSGKAERRGVGEAVMSLSHRWMHAKAIAQQHKIVTDSDCRVKPQLKASNPSILNGMSRKGYAVIFQSPQIPS